MTSHTEYGFCFLCTRKQTIGHLRPHRTLFRHHTHITTTTQIVHPPDDLIYLASRTRSSFTASQSTSIYYFIFHFSADEHQHSIAAAKIPKLSLSRGQQSCHKYCAIFIRDNHEQCPRRSLSIPWGRAGPRSDNTRKQLEIFSPIFLRQKSQFSMATSKSVILTLFLITVHHPAVAISCYSFDGARNQNCCVVFRAASV